MWNEELDVTVNSYFLNHVVGSVQAKEDKTSWNFKGIYGFPEKVNKQETWNLVKLLFIEVGDNWIYFRDFNGILTEK